MTRERKNYGIVLAVAAAALTADRMFFDVPMSGPAQAHAEEATSGPANAPSRESSEKPASLKRRIEALRERAPQSTEDAFVMRAQPEPVESTALAASPSGGAAPLPVHSYTLRAVGGVGTEQAFAQVNGIFLKPGVADESGLTLLSIERQPSSTAESFTARIRTPEGRELALAMEIGVRH